MKKNTDKLQSELMSANSITEYFNANQESFVDETLTELICSLFKGRGISKAELARRSGSSTVYIHQVFAGRRNPSRNKLICLGIGLGISLEELQALLKTAGYAPLYAANKRDAVILFGVHRGASLPEIDDTLYENDMETLT